MNSLTKPISHEKTNLILYYQGFLSVAAIFVFYTKLDIYLERQGIGIPLYWVLGFIVASVPLFSTIFTRLQYIPHSVLIWGGVYLALPLTSILIFSHIPDQQFLEDHCRSMIFLLLMLVIFSQYSCILRWSKRAILLVTITNVFMYIYEFFNPIAFYLEQHGPGRASGFYHDSNEAAWALITGMIFTIDLVKPKYRIFYALFIFLGIAPTFSRGGFICFGLVILLFILTKIIPQYQALLLFFSGFMIIYILVNQFHNLSYLKTSDGTDLFTEDTISRVEFLLDPMGHNRSLNDSRLSHVDQAWKKFVSSPFIGNGLGSGQNDRYTSALGTAQRSHNIYIDLMVEYGFLGALIYPCLLFTFVWNVQAKYKKQLVIFVCFLLAWGFFSHSIISGFCNLISYAWVSNLAQQSRLKII